MCDSSLLLTISIQGNSLLRYFLGKTGEQLLTPVEEDVILLLDSGP